MEEKGIAYKFFLSPFPPERLEQFPKDLALGGMIDFLEIPKDKFERRVAIIDKANFYDWTHTNYDGAKVYSSYFSDVIIKGKNSFSGGKIHNLKVYDMTEEEMGQKRLSQVNFWDEAKSR